MNTHLKQLWAAMKLPEKLQKSYKFFVVGLTYGCRSPVRADPRQPIARAHAVDLVVNRVRVTAHNRPGLVLDGLQRGQQLRYHDRDRACGGPVFVGCLLLRPLILADDDRTGYADRLCGQVYVRPVNRHDLRSAEAVQRQQRGNSKRLVCNVCHKDPDLLRVEPLALVRRHLRQRYLWHVVPAEFQRGRDHHPRIFQRLRFHAFCLGAHNRLPVRDLTDWLFHLRGEPIPGHGFVFPDC